MKTSFIFLTVLILAIGGLFAQVADESDIMPISYTESQEDVQSKVYFGIYVEDLDFPKYQNKGYEYPYGILITGVVSGSPASQYDLRADDIIIEIDGSPVNNLVEFDRMRALMKPGDLVSIRIWRDKEITDTDMVLEARPKNDYIPTEDVAKKDYGWGGGSWIPSWFIFPVDDVNELISMIGNPILPEKGFGANAISSDGVFMSGGAGKGHVGNGIFIGGVGASYEYKISNPATNTSLKYEVSFAGATLEKRVMLTRNFAASLGAMFGGGGHIVRYSQIQTNPEWPNIITGDNFTATLKREYLVVQPRVELMLRLLDWLAIRAEVGYVYGIPSYGGWKAESNTGDDYTIIGSPDTKFQGLSFSVGPWFGF